MPLFSRLTFEAAIILPPSIGFSFCQVFIDPPALFIIGIKALISQEFNPVSTIKSI